jgi:hypothetical protein
MASSELSPADLAAYHAHGYLALPGVFSSAEVEVMRREVASMAELTLSATQHHGFPSGRAGVGLNAVGETVLIKLQPYLEMSLLLQRAAADPRVVCPLRQLMGGDEPVLMPEKSKINYKQVLDPSWAQGTAEGEGGAEGRLAASEGGQKGSVARPGEDFGRFPIHNDYAYYRAQRCPPSALTVRAFPGRLICLSVCLCY